MAARVLDAVGPAADLAMVFMAHLGQPLHCVAVLLLAVVSAALQLPDGVPRSFEGCAAIDEYPSTPFVVPAFQEPFRHPPTKVSLGETCEGPTCMDVFEIDEVYVPDYELFPRDVCPGGTKMLLYDGVFPGPIISRPYAKQVR